MHVQIAEVHTIWLLVVLRAEASQSIFKEVRLNRIYTLDDDVEADVELLVLYEDRVLHVALD